MNRSAPGRVHGLPGIGPEIEDGVVVHPEDLPPGVTSAPETLSSSATASLRIRAQRTAALGTHPVRVVARQRGMAASVEVRLTVMGATGRPVEGFGDDGKLTVRESAETLGAWSPTIESVVLVLGGAGGAKAVRYDAATPDGGPVVDLSFPEPDEAGALRGEQSRFFIMGDWVLRVAGKEAGTLARFDTELRVARGWFDGRDSASVSDASR